MGSGIAKALTGAAGLLLLVGVLKATFYVVKVGQRGVLMRGGMPVLKKDGHVYRELAYYCAILGLPSFVMWFEKRSLDRQLKQVGTYKIKRPGIKVKFPGWYDVDKVNVQRRIQELKPFDVDCLDGQHHIVPELATRVPCDDDGPEFYDYPAISIINSSEADTMFESYAGTDLVSILEESDKELRKDRDQLRHLLNERVGSEFDRVGYLLEGVNLRERSLTSIQKAIDAFAPKPTDDVSSTDQDAEHKPDNVHELPHPIIMSVALSDAVANS